jgi:hypothetical protein
MTAVASLGSHPYASEGQCKVVDNNKHICYLYLFLVEPVIDGVSAKVHKGRRFKQDEFPSLVPEAANRTVTAGRKNSIGCQSHGIQYLKSYIMTSILILLSDITQANNEIFQFA